MIHFFLRFFKSPLKSIGSLATAGVWLTLTLLALGGLANRDRAAGTAAHPPAAWRPQTALALDPVRPTLVMLLHPQCPCSRASVSELNHLAALCPNSAKMVVLFLRPAGYPAV